MSFAHDPHDAEWETGANLRTVWSPEDDDDPAWQNAFEYARTELRLNDVQATEYADAEVS